MDNILGIDLGTNSIGWALRNPLLQDNQIEKFGVITFNKGVGKDKAGEFSYAAERTKKRSTRRLYQARKYRLWATLETLINEGYCPLSVDNLDRWRKYSKEEARKNNNAGRVYPVDDKLFDAWIKLDFDGDDQPDYSSPYQLRKELAEVELDFEKLENRYKLGRALYHIAQRRGFKSSRKGADDIKEKEGNEDLEIDLQYSEKKKNKKINDLFLKYPEAKTIGSLFAILEKKGERIRENIAQHAIRENFKYEINSIFEFQNLSFTSSIYHQLVESEKNRNDGSIFYKRPLRSQKGLIGKCTLEQNKYRVPVSHPSFEKFRAWSFINNIYCKTAIKGLDFRKNPNESLPLGLSSKIDLYKSIFLKKRSKAYFSFEEIASFFKINNWDFNYNLKTTVFGCPISSRLKGIFGEDFENIRIPKAPSPKLQKDYYDLEDIWHILFSCEDQEYITVFAQEKLHLSDKNVVEFIKAWNATPVGYGMLSLNAINKINVFLESGLIYSEAVLLANLPEVIGKELFEQNKDWFIEKISEIIQENRSQKLILTITNSLVARHKNLPELERFGYKNNEYKLDDSDIKDINELIVDQVGQNKWNDKTEEEKDKIFKAVKDAYQAYFRTSSLELKFIKNEKHFVVKADPFTFYKTETGFYRLPKLIDSLAEFLIGNFSIDEKHLAKIYHPSEIEIYPKAKEDNSGNIKLATPKSGSFKNPMAMRTLYELRRLINYLIETSQIDSDTKVIVEVARDLNDANKRWAIETWQRRREEENQEFEIAIQELFNEQNISTEGRPISNEDKEKVRLWYEQNTSDSEELPPVTEDKKDIKGLNWQSVRKESYKEILAKKEQIDKYRLWLEQDCRCMYTGNVIKLTDLFGNNVIDFEHTIPRSVSFDNSMANLTVCFHHYNRTIKKNQIPYNLDNYGKEHNGYTAILPRLERWQEKVERIKQQIEYWKTKSKRASVKDDKDFAIKQRHLWQMDLEYWKNKVDRFTISEITSGFKNSQKVDTQLISKYAFHYLKSYFDRVDVQKGSITSDFRKIYGLQIADVKKDRSKHSHHAKDAAVLTLIPVASKRDEILKDYYEHKEQHIPYDIKSPFKAFKREYVWGIDDEILINNIAKNQTLTPAKRVVRKRGKEQFIEGTNVQKIATGDCIRGQLHGETFFGAIRLGQKDANGKLLKDENGNFIQSEQTKYVLRVPLTFKKGDSDGGSFKKLEDLEKVIVDKPLFDQIKRQVVEDYNDSFKDALEQGVYMYDKKGNKENKIRRVRIFKSVTEPLAIKKQTYLSKHDYKQHYYAGNATNSFFALYEGEGNKDFDYKNLFETAKSITLETINSEADLFEPTIQVIKGRKTSVLQLKFILRNGLKVLFLKDDETISELKLFSKRELSNRLYIYTNFEKNGDSSRLNFKYHLEARESKEIKEEYVESEVDFDKPKPSLRFAYSKYNFLVENFDFKIKIDGNLEWLW